MKKIGIVRNIDELGRIVIPKEMRTQMDIACGDPVEISTEGNKIILSKFSPRCLFCGEDANVSLFKGKKICKSCIAEIKSSEI